MCKPFFCLWCIGPSCILGVNLSCKLQNSKSLNYRNNFIFWIKRNQNRISQFTVLCLDLTIKQCSFLGLWSQASRVVVGNSKKGQSQIYRRTISKSQCLGRSGQSENIPLREISKSSIKVGSTVFCTPEVVFPVCEIMSMPKRIVASAPKTSSPWSSTLTFLKIFSIPKLR